MYRIILIFIIYSFLGWILEVIFKSISTGKFINRGFLSGPFCPIYGFSLVFIDIFLYNVTDNPIYIFLFSSLIISLLELIVGLLLDKIFNQRWWDYSNNILNFKGYICLKFSLTWGLICLIVIKYIHPFIIKNVELLPKNLGIVIIISILIMIIIDLIETVLSMLNLNKNLYYLSELNIKLNTLSNKIGRIITFNVIKTNKKFEELTKEKDNILNNIARKQGRIFKSFPNFKHTKYNDLLLEVKKSFQIFKK